MQSSLRQSSGQASSSSSFSSSNLPQHILIRGVNWVGDSVMTMPAVQKLKELWPQAHVTMLVPAKLADLWHGNPAVKEVRGQPPEASLVRRGGLFSGKSGVSRHTSRRASSTAADRLAGSQTFDLAIVFPNSFRSAWDVFDLAPRRIGYPGHWPRRYLLTDIVPEEFRQPPPNARPPLQIHHYLGIVKYLGGNAEPCPPKIYLCDDEIKTVRKKFGFEDKDEHETRSSQIFALCPGAEYGPAKRWLPDRFAEVARRVRAETGCQWVLIGGPADRAVCEEIAVKIGDGSTSLTAGGVINLAGKTTLRELCCVLARCKLLLTNDTGPMHLAAAVCPESATPDRRVGIPVVAIFGSSDPVPTGPYGDGHVIIRHPVECSPCFLRECPIDFRCMNRVSVEEVVQAVLQSSSSSSSSSSSKGK